MWDVDAPIKVSQTNQGLNYNSIDSQAYADESYSGINENRFSELQQKLDVLQNFFIKKLSDLKPEMKDLVRTEVSVNTDQFSDADEFSAVDENLSFLRQECSNKDKG